VTAPLRPARLAPADVVRLAASGLVSRPLRVVLSALGIAVGVAAMISVVGISVSSKAEVNRRLDRLGTNLLRVSQGQTLQGVRAPLPAESVAMIGRIAPVEAVAATGDVDAHVYRNDHVPLGHTGSIGVVAARPALLATLGATVRSGRWLTAPAERYPVVVLGSLAAERLAATTPGERVWLGGRWVGLAGVLDPVALAPELDGAAIVGWGAAQRYFGFDGHPATIYVRAAETQVVAVREVLGATANPRAPGEAQVSRPSDVLAARAATNATLSGLLLGLGGVALLVGGLGVGNTMVISILERRAEIGLRRSLGATRGQIRGQFLAESLLLSLAGGAGGAVLGTVVTGAYATVRGWPTAVPLWATAAGLGATLVVGAVAGVYPALRASRVSPTEALASA
jgi:putative ABC transport system permease protein